MSETPGCAVKVKKQESGEFVCPACGAMMLAGAAAALHGKAHNAGRDHREDGR